MNVENRMSLRPFVIPFALAFLVARCADHIAPPFAAVAQTQEPHFLRWAGTAPPQFTAIGALSPHGRNGVGTASPSPSLKLNHYTAAFWAVRGEQRSVQINYVSADGDSSWQFLKLTTTDPTYAPGIGDLAPGDSVLITVTIDSSNVKVSLEPTGLVFGNPAELQISYAGADGDLNGDGAVDEADSTIESQLLGMWYREGADAAWEEIPAVRSLADKSFTSALPHFCEYAVSW